MDDLQKLTIQIEADISRLERNLSQANRAIDKKLGKVDRRLTRSERRFQQWGRRIATSIQIGMVAAVAYAGREALATADRIDKLQDRIKDATRESGDFEKVWSGIGSTAIETGTTLEGNVELVQRLATASKDLGATSDDVLKLNDTVQKLGIISGSSTSALAAGTTQLAQGLGAGVFRAEEFNSILENIPAVANIIAKNLGKSTAELRNMVLAGELTSRQAFDALLAASEEVERRFAAIPPRLSTAWSGLLTAISLQIDNLNDSLKLTELVAEKLEIITAAITPQEKELAIQERLNQLLEERNRLLAGELAATPGETLASFLKGENKQELINELLVEKNAEIESLQQQLIALNSQEVSSHPDQEIRLGHMTGGDRDKPSAAPASALREIEALIAASEHEAELVGKTADEAARISAEYKIRNDLARAGITLTQEQEAAMKELLDEYERQVNETERLTEKFEKLEQASDRFADDMGRALVDSIVDGENALTSLTRAFKAALIRMAADALIINPLKQLFSPSGGNLFGNLFGGFYADGGNPPVGKMSVVGERGPELFIPKTAGTIVSNDNFAKMGSNIKIVNQTTGRIDSVQKTMTRGEVQLILREELPGAMAGQVAAPNSSFNKTFRANNSVNRKF